MHTHYIPCEKLPILVVRIWYLADQQQENNWYKQ